ncbi:MAG: UbiD family decarboxylase [Candidatus Caldarchaeum sp.]|nr:UbiD family decarboxylase [Candidatus Caldarchaeum sp.]
MGQTLEEWLKTLKENDLLHVVNHEVSIHQVAKIVSDNYAKATLIQKIEGYDMRLAANTASNRKMIALALNVDEDQVVQELDRRCERRVPPVVVDDAPCKQVVKTGDEVDLTEFPLHLQHELDAAPYITASVAVARDPHLGVYNLGIYRLMLRTHNETGVDVTAPHKLRAYYRNALEMGKPLQVAVVVGLPTIDLLGAEMSAPFDVDEYEVLGGIRGEPVELVRCETMDLLVPANAEIVLECEMPPIGWSRDEGPYGEFTGTYGALKMNPVLRVKAITHRSNPIFLSATHGGRKPGWTDLHLLFPIIELDLYRSLRQAGIDVRGVRLHPGGCGMWAIASIRQRAVGDSKTALALLLTSSRQAFPKYAVVVDDDINIYDDEDVIWAMTFRSQPSEDAVILKDLKAIPLDPSLSTEREHVSTSKMGFDATVPLEAAKERFERCMPVERPPSSFKAEASDEEVLEMLEKPRYFGEMALNYSGHAYRQFLKVLGRLRETGVVARDNLGRYVRAVK